VAGEIDKEVRAIIEDCYAKAKKIISDHKDVLYSCADLLMEKEKITGEEFDRLSHTEPAEQISPDPSTV
jgi:cell division protease FtsH